MRIAMKYFKHLHFEELEDGFSGALLDLGKAVITVLHDRDRKYMGAEFKYHLTTDSDLDCHGGFNFANNVETLDSFLRNGQRAVRTAMKKAGYEGRIKSEVVKNEMLSTTVEILLNDLKKSRIEPIEEVVENFIEEVEESFIVNEESKLEKEKTVKKRSEFKLERREGNSLDDIVFNLVVDALNSNEAKEGFDEMAVKILKENGIVPHTKRIELYTNGELKGTVNNPHKQFEDVLTAIRAKVNIALVGPAGSGKTYAVHKAADALGLPFYSKSVSAQTGIHEFFGYNDANGNYVETDFRRCFEGGGVFLLDEFDNGNPNVLAALNQATSNGTCAFADGMVIKHNDFICVAAGNTFGHGATADYVGRNPIDAATLDRFVFLHFDYDEDLEIKIAGNESWTRKVQRYRGNARRKKVKVVISPRASIHGAKLLAAGMSEKKVEELCIFKGLSDSERNLIIG